MKLRDLRSELGIDGLRELTGTPFALWWLILWGVPGAWDWREEITSAYDGYGGRIAAENRKPV
jgi:hypothetical protein